MVLSGDSSGIPGAKVGKNFAIFAPMYNLNKIVY
jgi:hypothetical protein